MVEVMVTYFYQIIKISQYSNVIGCFRCVSKINQYLIVMPDAGSWEGMLTLTQGTIEKFYRWYENVSLVDGSRDRDVSCRHPNAAD